MVVLFVRLQSQAWQTNSRPAGKTTPGATTAWCERRCLAASGMLTEGRLGVGAKKLSLWTWLSKKQARAAL